MKFKTKEELIEIEKHCLRQPRENATIRAFKSFAERVEFYKKYASRKALFQLEQNDAFKKCLEEISDEKFDVLHYNGWLFDYCFGDVIE